MDELGKLLARYAVLLTIVCVYVYIKKINLNGLNQQKV